jgi:hypothetical protein
MVQLIGSVVGKWYYNCGKVDSSVVDNCRKVDGLIVGE